jgi:hypothetical protein
MAEHGAEVQQGQSAGSVHGLHGSTETFIPMPPLEAISLAEEHADWERRVNDVLYNDDAEEDQPEYNEAPRVTVEEHRAQLHAQLEQS